MDSHHRIQGEYHYENMYLGSTLPRENLDRIKDGFDLAGDTIVASYPKAGSTWSQELIWLVLNSADVDTAKKTPLLKRVTYLELTIKHNSTLDTIATAPHPRLIKTHLPARFFQKQLPSGLKIFLIIRNPKDTLVSFYHYYRMVEALGNFKGSWDDFFYLYRIKHLLYGDYFEWYQDWLPYLDHPSVKLIKYEDMKMDLRAVVEDVATYLGKSISEDQMTRIIDHLSFQKMKDNKSVNYSYLPGLKQDISPFMRKGIVGDWQNYFTQEQSDHVDAEYRNTLANTKLNTQFSSKTTQEQPKL